MDGWFLIDNPTKMDDLGVPLFRKPLYLPCLRYIYIPYLEYLTYDKSIWSTICLQYLDNMYHIYDISTLSTIISTMYLQDSLNSLRSSAGPLAFGLQSPGKGG